MKFSKLITIYNSNQEMKRKKKNKVIKTSKAENENTFILYVKSLH